MSPKRAFPGAATVACDFLIGLVLFAALVMLCGVADVAGLSAHAMELAPYHAPRLVELREGRGLAQHMPALLTLGVAFASTFALNLWFARHVSRVYASTRRGG